MKTYSSHILVVMGAMSLFPLSPVWGQRSLSELRAETLSKIAAYKARHPANAVPQND